MMIYLEITEHLDLGKIIFTKITHLDLATKIKLVSTLKLFLGFLTFKSNYFPEQIRALRSGACLSRSFSAVSSVFLVMIKGHHTYFNKQASFSFRFKYV